MVIDRSAMKRRAQELNKSARVNVYLFTLLFLAILAALTALDTLATGGSIQEVLDYYGQLGIEANFTLPTLPLPPMVAAFLGIAATLLTQVVQCGYYVYHLRLRRGETSEYVTLFDGFLFPGKIILLSVVVSIFVALWTMLFFFPGIIALYRYRFAYYNLCSDPDMGIMDAIRLSCQQTQGYKWQLFVLDLSFLGWDLLCVLTAGILNVWLLPYRQQTDVGFYYAICQNKGIPIPGKDPEPFSLNTPDF